MRCIRVPIFCLTLLPGVLLAATSETSVRDVPIRPNVTVRVLLIKPAKPAAAVILFAGGNGGLNIGANGIIGSLSSNFLLRSRNRFVQHNLTVAVIDAPSDRLPSPALNGFRQTAEHAQDIAAVIAFLRGEAKIPVWLVGTSRGTTSVANTAIRLQQGGPDGIVLTSSIVDSTDSDSLAKMDVAQILVRTLLVHHSEDQCSITPFERVKTLMDRITQAPIVDLLAIAGGSTPKGDPCGAFHYHGFIGTEAAAVARISNWIRHGRP